jgi:hypothetical protein
MQLPLSTKASSKPSLNLPGPIMKNNVPEQTSHGVGPPGMLPPNYPHHPAELPYNSHHYNYHPAYAQGDRRMSNVHDGYHHHGMAPMTTTAAQLNSRMQQSTMQNSMVFPHSTRPVPAGARGSYFFGEDERMLGRSSSMRLRSSSIMSFKSIGGNGGVPRWSKDSRCKECNCKFNWITRRHHCRSCGHSFCFEHSTRKVMLPQLGYHEPVRVCDECFEYYAIESDGHAGMSQISPREGMFMNASPINNRT